PPLPRSSIALPECPEERGGAFQKPGDRSPLSGSGPVSDREIRIRIAAHSPSAPVTSWRERGEATQREERNEGVPYGNLCSHWPAAFPLFLHCCHQLCSEVCFTHSGAHTRHTCSCMRKCLHAGVQSLHTCTGSQETGHSEEKVDYSDTQGEVLTT
ncbi:hypothetical protein GOODEAATRI_026144, partial [Goodea atripinnis]